MLHLHSLFLFPNCVQGLGLGVWKSCHLFDHLTPSHLVPWKTSLTAIFHTLTEYTRPERILFIIITLLLKKSSLNLRLCSRYYQTTAGKKNKGLRLLCGSMVWHNCYQPSPVRKTFFLIFVPINLNKTSSSLPPRICTQATTPWAWSLKTAVSLWSSAAHTITTVFPLLSRSVFLQKVSERKGRGVGVGKKNQKYCFVSLKKRQQARLGRT